MFEIAIQGGANGTVKAGHPPDEVRRTWARANEALHATHRDEVRAGFVGHLGDIGELIPLCQRLTRDRDALPKPTRFTTPPTARGYRPARSSRRTDPRKTGSRVRFVRGNRGRARRARVGLLAQHSLPRRRLEPRSELFSRLPGDP